MKSNFKKKYKHELNIPNIFYGMLLPALSLQTIPNTCGSVRNKDDFSGKILKVKI
jgi:hypothetical protein